MKYSALLTTGLITAAAVLISGCSSLNGTVRKREYEKANRNILTVYSRKSPVSSITFDDTSTLEDYLAYAALNNPELEAAFYDWKAALEKIPQVQALPDPRFTYGYFIENIETRVGPQRHKIDLVQTFPWFGKLKLHGDIALRDADIKKQKYEALKRRLFYSVKETYYDYYFLSKSIDVTEENLKLLTYFETVARTMYTTGKAAYADVIKAQLELAKSEERLLSLRELKSPLTAKLNAALNRPSDKLLPLPSEIPVFKLTLTDDDIIRLINEHNPGLKAIEEKAGKEMKSVELAKKQFYPDITIGMSYIETGSAAMTDIKNSGRDPIVSMLSFNLPIWGEKYKAAVRQAQIRQKAAIKERENMKNSLISDVKTAIYNYSDSERKIELYRDTLIPKAKQSLNVTQAAFEAGEKDFLNLIDTQRTLLELELAHEKALTNHAKYYAQIEMLIGKDISESN